VRAALAVALLAAWLAWPLSSHAAIATPPVCPFNAGLLSGAFALPDGTRASMRIWTPTERAEQPVHRGLARMYVAPDAPLPRGLRFGVVLLSHGEGGDPLDLHATGTALARCGWIVAAPRHPGHHRHVEDARPAARDWPGLALHLSMALDALRADPRLAPHLDLERVAAAGFGSGAVAALQAAGARPDPARLAAHCARDPDEGTCALAEPGEASATTPAPPDRRIRAVIALAPLGTLFADDGLRAVEVPVLLYRAEADAVMAPPHHATRLARLLDGRATLRSVAGAGHLSFLSPVPEDLREAAGALGEDPQGFDRAAFNARLNAEIAGFLADTLGQGTAANSSRR
jgi:predicted dienelactone hydrolase